MKLRALRGAITVEANEPDAILSATEELVRAVMERNELDPEQMVSCIFTCTNDLDAEFPAVAARNLGLSSVPLLCAREIDVPGALPRVIRLLLHCYTDPDTEPQPRVPARRGIPPPRPPGRPVTGLEFNARVNADPGLPGGLDLRVRRRAREARLERDAVRAPPAGAGGGRGAAPDPQPLPGPGQGPPFAAVFPTAPAYRAGRIAIGNGSCELLLAGAEAMLEPGAEVVYAWPSFSIYPHLAAMSGARAVDVPLNDAQRARPRRDGQGGHAPPRGW